MAKVIRPGPVFSNLQTIRKDYLKEKALISESKPLSFGFFSVDYEWLSTAAGFVRDSRRSSSYPEFYEVSDTKPYYRVFSHMAVECISAGHTVIILLNTCPVAQVDFKSGFGMAQFFELPAMTKEDWEFMQVLGAGTLRFEIEKNDHDVVLTQIKKEEGMLNTLQMMWRINLTNGESRLEVKSEIHRLPCDPTLDNLMDWVDVRSGRAHPATLKQF